MNCQFRTALIIFFTIVCLSGCSTTSTISEQSPQRIQSIEQRNQQLLSLNSWKIKGKIAFLQAKKRQSASINWQVNADNQKLNLSTFLGISVLKLTSNNGLHTIEVNGEKYKSTDLEALIYSLTQLTLPTHALSYWLKGLSYQATDNIIYHPETNLPKILNSQYDNRLWQINYGKYVNIDKRSVHTKLPTKITISQGDLTIKIAINSWGI
ncbi:MAG: outer membrane lipoprotein LolB [Alteromonadaceae bacterium]|jgi:outer membrane lipoprotein LolB